MSNKSVKHNAVNSREYLSLPKNEIDHDNSDNNDDTMMILLNMITLSVMMILVF